MALDECEFVESQLVDNRDPDEEAHSTEELPWKPLDPIELKEKGNGLFRDGDINAAIEVWKQALKAALKKSVREPSPKLTELQTSLRMNLALGFMKEEDYIMAKEHILVVYENAPKDVKIFYRLAEIYLGLHVRHTQTILFLKMFYYLG